MWAAMKTEEEPRKRRGKEVGRGTGGENSQKPGAKRRSSEPPIRGKGRYSSEDHFLSGEEGKRKLTKNNGTRRRQKGNRLATQTTGQSQYLQRRTENWQSKGIYNSHPLGDRERAAIDLG